MKTVESENQGIRPTEEAKMCSPMYRDTDGPSVPRILLENITGLLISSVFRLYTPYCAHPSLLFSLKLSIYSAWTDPLIDAFYF